MEVDERGLPAQCLATHPTTGETIIIVRDERGYHPFGKVDVHDWNRRHGISRAQVEAMLAGSMFGFSCPAARPEAYPELAEVAGHG